MAFASQAVVLAHQYGWDEMLLVAGPIALFVWVLRVANRRADRQQADAGRAKGSSGSADVSAD